MDKKRIQKIAAAIVTVRDTITDEQALSAQALFPEWKVGIEYQVGARLLYNDVLYKVLQVHISQETWTPVDAPSLYAKVLIPDENVIPAWEQPDSTNPYMTGDKTTHNNKTWVSNCDNNIWEPGVYGWDEVSE